MVSKCGHPSSAMTWALDGLGNEYPLCIWCHMQLNADGSPKHERKDMWKTRESDSQRHGEQETNS